MGIFTTTAATKVGGFVADKIGIKLPKLNLFGKKEPNAGSSSFVDALDNFEKISNAKARSMVTNVTAKIASGASDNDIERYIALQGGYRPGELKASWKWQYVQRWINKTREMQRSAAEVTNTRQFINEQQSNPGASINGINFKNPAIYLGAAAVILGGIYLGGNLLKK